MLGSRWAAVCNQITTHHHTVKKEWRCIPSHWHRKGFATWIDDIDVFLACGQPARCHFRPRQAALFCGGHILSLWHTLPALPAPEARGRGGERGVPLQPTRPPGKHKSKQHPRRHHGRLGHSSRHVCTPPPPPSWEMRLPYSRSAGPAAEPRLRARCPVPSLCFISWRRVCSCPCLACVLTCSSHIVQQQAWSKAFLPPAPPTATLPLHQSHSLTHVHPSHITQGQACRQSVTQLTPKVLLPPSQGSH